MKVELNDQDVEQLTKIMDLALKSEGIDIFDKCLNIILKLRVAKQEELKAERETKSPQTKKVEEAEVEEVEVPKQRAARK